MASARRRVATRLACPSDFGGQRIFLKYYGKIGVEQRNPLEDNCVRRVVPEMIALSKWARQFFHGGCTVYSGGGKTHAWWSVRGGLGAEERRAEERMGAIKASVCKL